MKKFFVLAAVVVALATGCSNSAGDSTYKSTLSSLNDSSFNGSFSHDTSGSVYGKGTDTYTFNGKSRVREELFQYWSGGAKLNEFDIEWQDSQDIGLYQGDPDFPPEGVVSKGVFHERLWDKVLQMIRMR